MILIFIALLITSLFFIKKIPEKGWLARITHPLGFFTIFFAFVYYFVPILQIIGDVSRYKETFEYDNLNTYLAAIFSFIFQMAVYFGYRITGGGRIDKSTIRNAALNFDRKSGILLIISSFLFFIGVYFSYGIVQYIVTDYANYMTDRIDYLSGYGYQLILLKFSSVSVLLLMFCAIKNNNIKWRASILTVILINFVINAMIGSRTSSIILIIYLLFSIYLIYVGKNIKKLIFLSIPILIIVFSMITYLGQIRDAIKVEGINFSNDEIFSKSTWKNNIESVSINYGMTELASKYMSLEKNPAYGATFIAGLVNFVPRAIWDEKPTGGGPFLVNTLNPGAYNLGKGGNSSLTTGIVLESYMNFSWLGFVVGFIYGLIISKLVKYSLRLRNSVSVIIFILLWFALGMSFVSAEFLGVFSVVMILIIPSLFFSETYTLARFKRQKNPHENY
jgi:oligosaccharide repeat unit polymerase